MTKNNDVKITYDKIYIDDIGCHLPALLQNTTPKFIAIKSLFKGAIDGFIKRNVGTYFSCLNGIVRIVVAYDQGNNDYKFKQYFMRGLDGKIIYINENIWFGIQSLNETDVILAYSCESQTFNEERISYRLFNWHSKRW